MVLRVLQFLDCIDITSTGESVLRIDARVLCTSAEYLRYRDTAMALVGIYCVGFPVLVGVTLAASADRLTLRGGPLNAPMLLLGAHDVGLVLRHVRVAWEAFARIAPHGPSGRRDAVGPPATKAPDGTQRLDSVIASWDRVESAVVLRRLYDFAYMSLIEEAKSELVHMRLFSAYDNLLRNSRHRSLQVMHASYAEAQDRIENDHGMYTRGSTAERCLVSTCRQLPEKYHAMTARRRSWIPCRNDARHATLGNGASLTATVGLSAERFATVR